METQRIYWIDFVKTIGFLCLILAHVQPPEPLMYIRNFDVPLLVFLSAMLAQAVNTKFSFQYIWKRFKRIILPPWIFLCVFFTASYLFNVRWSILMIIKTFLFQRDSLGYVWIFWIYFMMAMMVPLINKFKPKKGNIFVIVLLYIFYELCYYFNVFTDNRIIDSTFYYLIPYSIVTYLGFYYSSFTKREKYWGWWISTLFFIVIFLENFFKYGEVQMISEAKYPPRLYYLSYSFMIINNLLLAFYDKNYKLFKNRLILFISSHTMWIYLQHILVIMIVNKLLFDLCWYMQFGIVLMVSCIIVFVQNFILDIMSKKFTFQFWDYFRG